MGRQLNWFCSTKEIGAGRNSKLLALMAGFTMGEVMPVAYGRTYSCNTLGSPSAIATCCCLFLTPLCLRAVASISRSKGIRG